MARFAVVKASWVALNPIKRLDVSYWLAVIDTLQRQGINSETATLPRVQAAIDTTEDGLWALRAQKTELRKQAMALELQAREIEVGPNPTPKRFAEEKNG
jgi:hypothetical protein